MKILMKILWSKNFIIPTLAITILYIVATIYLMNAGLVKDTLLGAHSLAYKWNLLVALLAGMWTAMSRLNLALLFIVAFLTGANLTLITKRLSTLRSSKKLRVVVGGSSLLGIVGSGCASCGLSILAFLGLSGAIAYLPFRGIELSIIAIVLLIVSLYSLLKNQSQEKECTIPNPKLQKI